MQNVIEPLVAYLDDFSLIRLREVCKYFCNLFVQSEFVKHICSVKESQDWPAFTRHARTEKADQILENILATRYKVSTNSFSLTVKENTQLQKCIQCGIGDSLVKKLHHEYCYLDRVLSDELLNEESIIIQFVSNGYKLFRSPETLLKLKENILLLLIGSGVINSSVLKELFQTEHLEKLIEFLLRSGITTNKQLCFCSYSMQCRMEYLELLHTYGYVVEEIGEGHLEKRKVAQMLQFLSGHQEYSVENCVLKNRNTVLKFLMQYGSPRVENNIISQIVSDYSKEYARLLANCTIDCNHFLKCLIKKGRTEIISHLLARCQPHQKEKLNPNVEELLLFLIENDFPCEDCACRLLLRYEMITNPLVLKQAIAKRKKKIALVIVNFGFPLSQDLLALPYDQEMYCVYQNIRARLAR